MLANLAFNSQMNTALKKTCVTCHIMQDKNNKGFHGQFSFINSP